MPEVVKGQGLEGQGLEGRSAASRFSLNSDGRPHPLENALALVTFVIGMAAFVTGLIPVTHVIGSWAGLAAFVVGLYSQMISATTAERYFTVIGLTAGFVGMGLGVAHGGFIP